MPWTNDYIRIPFLERGRTREGADCWGLVKIVYEERLGVVLPELTDYEHTKDKKSIPKIIKEESSHWSKVPLGSEREYDVAVFRMCGLAMHVGVVVKQGVMLHCERGSGTYVSEYLTEMQWSRRLEGFYRHANCSDRNPAVYGEP